MRGMVVVMKDNSLSIAFGNSLKEDVVSCITDLTEVGLDAIMDDGLLKDIPFVSTAISLYRIGRNIAERYYIKKLATFLNEINNNIIDEDKRQEYISKIKDNTKFRNQELEYILVLIDRYVSYDKPQMLAKLYLAYLNGVLIWEELTMYAEVIDRFLQLDFRTLITASERIIVHRNIGGESVLRLVALGLMAETNENSIIVQSNGGFGITAESIERYASNDKVYRRTEFGDKLAEILK